MPRKIRAKVSSKKSKLTTSVYNRQGKIVGKITLPEEIFGAHANAKLIAQAVRVYLANQRRGTHQTKTRAQVSGSTRKIYRQKGTGRARHGDIKAPIFIGGGVAHGPKIRDYSLSLPDKMRRASLLGALSDKFRSGEVKVVAGLGDTPPKTRKMLETLKNLHFFDEKEGKLGKTLLVLPENIRNVFLSCRNLENLTTKEARLLNIYEILSHKNVVFMREAIPKLEETFLSDSHPKSEDKATKKGPIKSARKVKVGMRSRRKVKTSG